MPSRTKTGTPQSGGILSSCQRRSSRRSTGPFSSPFPGPAPKAPRKADCEDEHLKYDSQVRTPASRHRQVANRRQLINKVFVKRKLECQYPSPNAVHSATLEVERTACTSSPACNTTQPCLTQLLITQQESKLPCFPNHKKKLSIKSHTHTHTHTHARTHPRTHAHLLIPKLSSLRKTGWISRQRTTLPRSTSKTSCGSFSFQPAIL